MKNRTLAIGIILVALLFCMLGFGLVAGAGFFYLRSQQVAERPITIFATPTSSSVSGPVSGAKQDAAPIAPPTIDLTQPTETELALNQTIVPVRDLRTLASRLKYGGQSLPEVVNDTPPSYASGDKDSFWILDNSSDTPEQFQRTATLQYVTDHAYWWVEDGFSVDQDDLQRSADIFETQTYPTNRAFFGSEWSPGVDNDVRVSIYMGDVPGVGGYYASSHEFSAEVDPYSNEREMFFINLRALQPGDSAFDGVLAHEFQHMIHWHQDRNEETWVNEGLSELAVFLNQFSIDRAEGQYLRKPDLQLTTWAENPRNAVPHYGSSYLFMAYFLEQFGEEMMQAVVAEPANSIQGFNNVLKARGLNKTFDDVFADFAVANYLNDPDLAEGQWGYRALSFKPAAIDTYHGRFPLNQQSTVRQYGVDYIELDGKGPLTIDFAGDAIAPLLNNNAYSGRYQWYSNRGDDSDSTLTRAVNLQNVPAATLNYAVWYDIEEDWDYAYVQVSTDGGQSWTVLETPDGRTTNPTGNAYGSGYTGKSGGWLEQSVDLTSYAGQEILLRFEYITDDATNGPGFALDDVTIPEIGLFDDVETPDSGWVAEGFIRTDNVLRQRYIVQVIEEGNPPTVIRIPLDASNHGSLTIGQPGQKTRAVLVISAQAPVTTEEASYRYSIQNAE